MSLLRGNIYDAMDDRDQAVLAYRTALRHDCCCYEAFKHLTEHHLLTSADEQALISEIAFGGDDAWLEAVLAGLSEVDAAWRADAHASAGPAVYVFTKRRSACRDVELVVHEYG